MASDNKNLESQRREENGIVYFDRGTREGRDGKKYDRFAIQTHFVEVGEDASALIEKYVRPLYQEGDCLSFTAKVMGMCTGAVRTLEDTHPGFWAKLLCRFVHVTPAGPGAGTRAHCAAEMESPLADRITITKVEPVPVALPIYPGNADPNYLRKEPGLYPDLLRPYDEYGMFNILAGDLNAFGNAADLQGSHADRFFHRIVGCGDGGGYLSRVKGDFRAVSLYDFHMCTPLKIDSKFLWELYYTTSCGKCKR